LKITLTLLLAFLSTSLLATAHTFYFAAPTPGATVASPVGAQLAMTADQPLTVAIWLDGVSLGTETPNATSLVLNLTTPRLSPPSG
jgi:hypothetical protein